MSEGKFMWVLYCCAIENCSWVVAVSEDKELCIEKLDKELRDLFVDDYYPDPHDSIFNDEYVALEAKIHEEYFRERKRMVEEIEDYGSTYLGGGFGRNYSPVKVKVKARKEK